MNKTNAKFADTYEGCQVVANLMGLGVETVRKRAKAGKIPGRQNQRGTWVFRHAELVAAGIYPFTRLSSVAPATTVENKTEVVFVLDRSGSMINIADKVREGLGEQIAQLYKSSGPNDRYNVSIINFNECVVATKLGAPVQSLGLMDAGSNLYANPNGGTALLDAIAEAIAITKARDDGESAFLISVLTDGEENSSKKTEPHQLRSAIADLNATGRYTFTFAGPAGSTSIARSLGVPIGNCTTWEATNEGTARLNANTVRSLDTYTETRSKGVMRSESFYAQPVTLDPAKFAKQLDRKLVDVTDDVSIERVTAADPTRIKDFAMAKFGSFKTGEIYYELTESEKVQSYKGIIVQDKTKGQFFSGWETAKHLLGIPDFKGTVNIRPGQLGDFKVFVQSTSHTRKLVPGTAVVRLGT